MSDLLTSGLLHAGQKLVFRKNDGPVAQVTADGKIRFEGTDYASPSAAGTAAAGGTSTNGWVAWHVPGSDRLTSLANLRERHASG